MKLIVEPTSVVETMTLGEAVTQVEAYSVVVTVIAMGP